MDRKENMALWLNAFLKEASAEKLKNGYDRIQKLMSCYRCAILEVETKFRVLNEQFSLQHERNPIDSIKSRLKSPESITEKLHRKELPITVDSIEENLHDVAGVRVICSFIDDIYMLAKCFVQLRTIAMEFWANLEHWMRYKKNLSPELIKETYQELNECALHILFLCETY